MYGNQNWCTSIQGVTADLPRDARLAGGRRARSSTQRTKSAPRASACSGRRWWRICSASGRTRSARRSACKNVPLRVIGVLAPQGPVQLRPGSGRRGPDAVHHRRAQGARRRGTRPPPAAAATATHDQPYAGVPTASSIYYGQHSGDQPVRHAPKMTGVRQHDLRAGAKRRAGRRALTQMTDTLARRHRIQPGQDDDFTVRNLSDIAQAPRAAAA